MDEQQERVAGYVVPSYTAPEGTAWYHFLHGNVPGHQIDFIYRPEVPQGPLTRQHFSHLMRLLKYIEPQSNERFAFAIGNLSRDDTQHEPGHGGMALIFALRIPGVVDHAGRQDPPFAHGVAAIDRALDYPTLIEAAVAFHRRVLATGETADWYRAYVRGALEDPDAVRGLLDGYVGRFADLPHPPSSAMTPAWITGGAPQPRRIVVAHHEDIGFGEVAVAAARIASVLYRSDIRWTSISNGREDDVPNGVSIRLLARTELGPADASAVVHDLLDLPDEEGAIASMLFGVKPVENEEKRPRGWRDRLSGVEAPPGRAFRDPGSSSDSGDVSVDLPSNPNGAPGRARRTSGWGTDSEEVSVEIAIGRRSSQPGARPSAPAAPQDPEATLPVPVRPVRSERPPAMVDPQAAPPIQAGPGAGSSEPPQGDRAALLEVPIPAAPRAPGPDKIPVSSAPPPAPAVEPPPKVAASATPPPAVVPPLELPPPPNRARWTPWLVVGGVCALAVVLVVWLTSQGGAPVELQGPSNASSAEPTTPDPPAAPPEPNPPPSAPAPPAPSSEAAPPAKPRATAGERAAPPVKRPPPPPAKPVSSSSVFGGHLD